MKSLLILILVFFLSFPCYINGQTFLSKEQEGYQAYHRCCLEGLFCIEYLPISDTINFEKGSDQWFYIYDIKVDTHYDKDSTRFYEIDDQGNKFVPDIDPDLEYVADDNGYGWLSKKGFIKNNAFVVYTINSKAGYAKIGVTPDYISSCSREKIGDCWSIDYHTFEDETPDTSNIWEIEDHKPIDGIPHGEYKEWSLSEKGAYYLSCKGRYNEGEKYGAWEYYDEDGNVTQTQNHH